MSEPVFPQNATQQFIDVQEIKNGVIRLKGGGLRAVVMVAGINFELKSEEEQDGITGAYQNFLNALDFSIQVIIHSRKLNITNYLHKMEGIRDAESNELLKNQTVEYIEFIKGFVKENEIMTKTFFVVVPYDGGGVKELQKGVSRFLPFLSGQKNKHQQEESDEEKFSQLQQRVDEVLTGLERIGLRAVMLNDDELLELYYNLYNPEAVEKSISTHAAAPATRPVTH